MSDSRAVNDHTDVGASQTGDDLSGQQTRASHTDQEGLTPVPLVLVRVFNGPRWKRERAGPHAAPVVNGLMR